MPVVQCTARILFIYFQKFPGNFRVGENVYERHKRHGVIQPLCLVQVLHRLPSGLSAVAGDGEPVQWGAHHYGSIYGEGERFAWPWRRWLKAKVIAMYIVKCRSVGQVSVETNHCRDRSTGGEPRNIACCRFCSMSSLISLNKCLVL